LGRRDANVKGPAVCLGSLRSNVVVEVSTVQFTLEAPEKDWETWTLKRCAPDVLTVMRLRFPRGLVNAIIRRRTPDEEPPQRV
jgi:hypothetical protein